jgi:hypothetical protein
MEIKNSIVQRDWVLGWESKTRQVQRDWVLGQGLSKTRQVSEIGHWDGNQKLDRSAMSAGTEMSKTRDVCDECRDRDVKNSGCMGRERAVFNGPKVLTSSS